MFFRAASNPSKLCFWLLAHIFCDPALLALIRKEAVLGISSGKLDIQYLVDQCPLLNASLDEILRLMTASNSARTVQSNTRIGDKVLLANSKVLIPYRQLHFAEEFYGPDVSTFNPTRFLENRALNTSPFFKPLEGG